MTKQSDASGHYKGFFKNWSKALGARPTVEQLATIHALGARPGKQALANAMMLRDGGATAAQIVMACGAPQLNKMRDLVARKLVTRDMNVAPSDAGHTVYKISLAAKGKTAIEKAATAAVEGTTDKAKPARKRKAKPAKVTPEAAAVEPVTEIELIDQPQAQ